MRAVMINCESTLPGLMWLLSAYIILGCYAMSRKDIAILFIF